MTRDRPLIALVSGVLLVLLGGVASAPSRPLAARTKYGSLAVLVGAGLVLWGLVRLKRRRDRRRRER